MMQSVKWAEGVVDNENMGKKSSKSEAFFLALIHPLTHCSSLPCLLRFVTSDRFAAECCVFHRQKLPGEWDSDSEASDGEGCPDCQEVGSRKDENG